MDAGRVHDAAQRLRRRRRHREQPGNPADRDADAQRGQELVRGGPHADQHRARDRLAAVGDDRLHATLPHPERAHGRALADIGAADRRGGEQRANQARRVEPAVRGVEGDLAHVVGNEQRRLHGRDALACEERRRVAAAGEPRDAGAQLTLGLVARGPFERAPLVMTGRSTELARQLAVRGHAVRVQPVVGLGLLPHRVQPRERRAARALAGDAGVERHHARARARRGIGRRGAHDPQPDNGDIVMLHSA